MSYLHVGSVASLTGRIYTTNVDDPEEEDFITRYSETL